VWRCETVERKAEIGETAELPVVVDLDSTVYRQSTFGFNCYVIGLRLWLTAAAPGSQPQELGMRTVLPTAKEVDVTSYRRMGGSHFGHVMMVRNKMYTFEGIKKSVENFNQEISTSGLPGRILSAESTTIKIAEGGTRVGVAEAADQACWSETSSTSNKRKTQIVRLFYVKGPPTKCALEIQEFLPTQLTQSSMGKPAKYAKFSDVIEQARSWMRDKQCVRVVSLETRDAKLKNTFLGTPEIETDSADDIEVGGLDIHRLRYLRVFYVTEKSQTPEMHHAWLTTRLFQPSAIGGGRYETLVQTMARVDAWLKVTGMPILNVETITQMLGQDSEMTQYNLHSFAGKHWITSIRVYFPAVYTEPCPSLLPAPPPLVNSSQCCHIQ